MKLIGNHRTFGINTYSVAFDANTKAKLQAKVKWSSGNSKRAYHYYPWYNYSLIYSPYIKLGTILKGEA